MTVWVWSVQWFMNLLHLLLDLHHVLSTKCYKYVFRFFYIHFIRIVYVYIYIHIYVVHHIHILCIYAYIMEGTGSGEGNLKQSLFFFWAGECCFGLHSWWIGRVFRALFSCLTHPQQWLDVGCGSLPKWTLMTRNAITRFVLSHSCAWVLFYIRMWCSRDRNLRLGTNSVSSLFFLSYVHVCLETPAEAACHTKWFSGKLWIQYGRC